MIIDLSADLPPSYADQLQRWRMYLGKHNMTYTEPSERYFNVSGIYRHEGFQYPTVPTVEFDIALVKLDGDVTPSDEISYACLPSVEEMLPEGKNCYATGWGDETGTALPLHICYLCLLNTSLTFFTTLNGQIFFT